MLTEIGFLAGWTIDATIIGGRIWSRECLLQRYLLDKRLGELLRPTTSSVAFMRSERCPVMLPVGDASIFFVT